MAFCAGTLETVLRQPVWPDYADQWQDDAEPVERTLCHAGKLGGESMKHRSLLARAIAIPVALTIPSVGSAQEIVEVEVIEIEVEDVLIDAQAVEALQKMGEALAAKQTIAFDASLTSEIVLESGQKIQFGGTMQANVVKPDKMRMVVTSAAKERQYYFDGEQFAIVAPRKGFWTNFQAPPTLNELFSTLLNDYDIEIPVADLFIWQSNPEILERIQEGYVVRPDLVLGKTCMHYAFRQELVDWQLWLNEESLPCKLVITDKEDESLPQYTVIFRWNDPDDDEMPEFTYQPKETDTRITYSGTVTVQGGGE